MSEQKQPVSVVGLGDMGAALALAFVDAGHPTTVWNRTIEKADRLVQMGATAAPSLVAAASASPLVVVNVTGGEVARGLLERAGDALAYSDVVNLSDGTAGDARRTAAWAAAHGVGYVHGQIETIPAGIGDPSSVIVYGGSAEVYERHRTTLDVLAGNGRLVSDDPGTAALFGMGIHSVMWGLLNGFVHAAGMLTAEGVEVGAFLAGADVQLRQLHDFLGVLAAEIDKDEYAVPTSGLAAHLPSIEDLLRQGEDVGLDNELVEVTRRWVARAVGDGHGADNYSRLVDYVRAG
ncbi:NAD(P)-binding domain-containing protein [Actinopolymorpha sp. B17G11]|uniref:NAD(P)-dependent oxidoreductase n=1 Tax=unclassified Actinopolymorpha TaxID=2627063 RepID=UPI0032D934DD